jgi:surface antigen
VQGWHVDHTPRAGSVVVFEPNTHGAGRYGHVAFVLDVYPSTGAIR